MLGLSLLAAQFRVADKKKKKEAERRRRSEGARLFQHRLAKASSHFTH